MLYQIYMDLYLLHKDHKVVLVQDALEQLQGNLRRMGAGDMVTVRRRGEPRGPITNASIFPDWKGAGYEGEMHEWQVPLSHIVGFGHPPEGEVFVRHP